MVRPRFVRKFQRNLRDYGPRITLRKTFATLLKLLYVSRCYRIYRIDLRGWRAQETLQGDLEYRFISHRDQGLISQIENLEDWLQGTVGSRLRRGAICLVALDGEALAGFNLVSFGRVTVPLIDCEWRFPCRTAWSEQITVSPDYRGRNIAAELRYRMFAELQRRGIQRFYGGALAFNAASLKLARKVGFREIVEVHYRKLLGIRSREYVRLRT